jgi:outer membrane receptor protein involved in Fe transport
MQLSKKFPVLPVAAAVASALSTATPALAQDQRIAVLEEVIVTARKRTESVQDIPASIMAISQDDLKVIGARSIDDYSRFLPSLNVVSYGAGDAVIVFRGATIDAGGYVAQSTSSVYLDEISVTSTGAQPAVRMVDIARVEALAGPQGTLYGSDAQAGTLRIVTNQPVIDEFELVLDGSVRTGSDSDESYDASIVLNLPLVEDKLALRVVAFDAEDGGFIDNIFGHTPENRLVLDYPGGTRGTLDNSQFVEDNWNESEVSGWRAALKWQINEDWSATVMALHQETNSGADNGYDPSLGDLETIRFFDDYRDDEYDLYSLTIEADLGFAQLVSATSYYDRDIDEVFDATAYHHYWNAAYCQVYDYADLDYYYWIFPNPDGDGGIYNALYCMAPTVNGDYLAAFGSQAQQERFTQEIRLSSTGDTFDWLVGLYYEDSSNDWQDQYGFPTSNDYQDSIAAQYYEWLGVELEDGVLSPWNDVSLTDWEQKAVFGEVTWHATEKINLTLGGRYFDREHTNEYWLEQPTGNRADDYVDGPTIQGDDETEFVPKVALAYDWTDDTMVYGLVSVGYKPGGTNRQRGEPFFPRAYEADKMTNYETGIRSTFADGAARANVTLFYMDWEDFQLEIVDPSFNPCPGGEANIPRVCGQPWQESVVNAGDAHILGVTAELDWAITDRFVVGMNAEWLEAETDSDLDLDGDDELDVVKGSQLPVTPDFSGAAWATYTWPLEMIDGSAYARLQWSYMDETVNQLQPIPADGSSPAPQLVNDSYDIGDFSVGFLGPSWEVTLFVNNITDERAQFTNENNNFLFGSVSSSQGRSHWGKIYTGRPREYGIRLIKRWGD